MTAGEGTLKETRSTGKGRCAETSHQCRVFGEWQQARVRACGGEVPWALPSGYIFSLPVKVRVNC